MKEHRTITPSFFRVRNRRGKSGAANGGDGNGRAGNGAPSNGGPEKAPLARRLLDFDARVDHSLFAARVYLRTRYDDFSAFMDRFYVAGIKRLAVEAVSEGFTLTPPPR